MIILAGTALGGILGARAARRQGGNGKDMAQFVAVGAIIGTVLGTMATITLGRLL